jgi:hypothetical protein
MDSAENLLFSRRQMLFKYFSFFVSIKLSLNLVLPNFVQIISIWLLYDIFWVPSVPEFWQLTAIALTTVLTYRLRCDHVCGVALRVNSPIHGVLQNVQTSCTYSFFKN